MLGFSDSVPGEKALRMFDFFKYLEQPTNVVGLVYKTPEPEQLLNFSLNSDRAAKHLKTTPRAKTEHD